MKLHILSDLHREFPTGEFDGWEIRSRSAMKNTYADVTILAGDTHTKGRGIELAASYWPDRPVITIAGNHEYYGQVYPSHMKEIREAAAEFENVHFLENDVVEIGNVVFLGCTLWTDCKLWESGPHAGLSSYPETIEALQHSMTDYARITFFDGWRYRVLKPADLIKVHLDSVRWLKSQFEAFRGRKVVVITHHAPSFKSVPEIYQKDAISAGFASHLDELVESSGAALWIHGHNHGQSDYRIGKTRVICNSKGYPSEAGNGFKPSLVVKV
ncbi:MAG: metallophosphoesterase [Methanosarcina mazei]|nr:metallophosphoesterase [Methanosarcina mazei]